LALREGPADRNAKTSAVKARLGGVHLHRFRGHARVGVDVDPHFLPSEACARRASGVPRRVRVAGDREVRPLRLFVLLWDPEGIEVDAPFLLD